MEHLFLNKDLSLLAKEKGFDEPCFAYYVAEELRVGFRFNHPDHNRNSIGKLQYKEEFETYSVFAPLYQQIIDWFREKHKIQFSEFPLLTSPIRYALSKNSEFLGGYELNKAIEEAFKLI